MEKIKIAPLVSISKREVAHTDRAELAAIARVLDRDRTLGDALNAALVDDVTFDDIRNNLKSGDPRDDADLGRMVRAAVHDYVRGLPEFDLRVEDELDDMRQDADERRGGDL